MRRQGVVERGAIALVLASLLVLHGLSLAAAAPGLKRPAKHEIRVPAPAADSLALPGAKQSPRIEAQTRTRLPFPHLSAGRLARTRQHALRRPAQSPVRRARSHAIHQRVGLGDDPPH